MSSQQLLPPRQLSQEDTIRYFSPEKHTRKIITILISSITAGLCIILMLSNIGDPLYEIGFALLFIFVGGTCYWRIQKSKKKIPTFEEYERWLNMQAQALYYQELKNLGIDKNQISDRVLSFHSYVLPGSRAAECYSPKHLQIKRNGKHWHSSINVYTYFVPTSYDIGMIMFDINAFNHRSYTKEYTDNTVYAYETIKGIKSEEYDDIVLYAGREYACQIDRLCLIVSDGITKEVVDITAAVRATFMMDIDNQETLVTLTPTSDLERKMNKLRHIIIKNQRWR